MALPRHYLSNPFYPFWACRLCLYEGFCHLAIPKTIGFSTMSIYDNLRAPYLSQIRRKKSQHLNIPMAQHYYRKVTSGGRKSHQGRTNTMVQPISPVIGHLGRSRRSIAHSDDFEEYKWIQTNSWQQSLLAWISYIGALLRPIDTTFTSWYT